MPGVFSLNEGNIKIQNKVAELNGERDKLAVQYQEKKMHLQMQRKASRIKNRIGVLLLGNHIRYPQPLCKGTCR